MSGRTSRSKARGEIPNVPEEFRGMPERIAYARERLGLDVSVVRSSRWERGVRLGGVKALTLVRLARQLGVRVAWLLEDEQPMLLEDAAKSSKRLTDTGGVLAVDVAREQFDAAIERESRRKSETPPDSTSGSRRDRQKKR